MKIKLLIIGLIILAIAGYLYLTKFDNNEAEQGANTSEFIDPKEILKYDPNAPAWMQEAESCKIVAGKIFCKMAGE